MAFGYAGEVVYQPQTEGWALIRQTETHCPGSGELLEPIESLKTEHDCPGSDG